MSTRPLEGRDGFASLEVSPRLAHDTEGTIRDARRLWSAVERPNLMIKVPGTREGVPAIEALTAQGVNVNVTLLFSVAQYEAAAQAYIRGLSRLDEPRRTASVASLFVSRVDTHRGPKARVDWNAGGFGPSREGRRGQRQDRVPALR